MELIKCTCKICGLKYFHIAIQNPNIENILHLMEFTVDKDRGAWWTIVHGVKKESDTMTVQQQQQVR